VKVSFIAMSTQSSTAVNTSEPLPDSSKGSNGLEATSDAALQVVRRIDWRFLLPDPNLGQVAHIGPAQATLLESLRLFSESLTVIGMPCENSGTTGQYDLVVASRPSYQALREAADLVRPGGFVYVEAYGPFWPGRLRRRNRCRLSIKGPRLRHPADYVAALQRLGLTEVQPHWHWPDFESCTRIVPLDDQAALRYVFVQRGRGTRARVKAWLGRCLLWSGLLAWVVPCFSIVAHRGVE
jgi:hypothetical protein